MNEAAGATPNILVFNQDLFFGVRIGNLLKAAGYTPVFAKTSQEFVSALEAADSPPVLAIVDLGAGPDWAVIQSAPKSAPILAFGPHKDVDALRAAKAAGVARVVSNSEFHMNALALVERYASKPQ